MRKLLNTLYVTSEGASLRKDGENIVAEIDGAERARVPFHLLASVVMFGPILISPALVGACAAGGISVVLLDRAGRFQARVEGPVSGNVLLRRAQYNASDRPEPIVRSVVLGKVANQRAVLMRALRDYGDEYTTADRAAITAAVDRLAQILRQVEFRDDPLDRLRGAEGEAANLYFGVFGHLVRSEDPQMVWRGRSRRPPLDPINALLSFLYTLLAHDCRSAAEAVGLDPAVGFLHRDRPGRPSLALDLMEEFRAVLADRLALSLINRRQLQSRDFEQREGGAVMLTESGRKTVLTAWQERKKDERTHPFLGEKAPLGLVPFLQAQMLARHLRGDLDVYPPLVLDVTVLVLVTYDVRTSEPGGAGRLRRVAKTCRDFGQRVQFSVFEIEVDPAQWTALKARLELIIDRRSDSLRYYHLGAGGRRRVEHVGAKPAADLVGPLLI